MKLVTFIDHKEPNRPVYGLFHNNQVLSFESVTVHRGQSFPDTMEAFLQDLERYEPIAREIDANLKADQYDKLCYDLDEITLLAPLRRPTSCRDGYAFRQHVASARQNRGVDMIPEFDSYPVFYFTNHLSIVGPGEVKVMKDHLERLDFELECGVIVGKRGRNLRAEDADQYIFGYTVLNDFSARLLQMEEMKLNLGPAKGKDFANAIGPMIVTPDELEPYRVDPKPGHVGNRYNLAMKARVNDVEVSSGNLGDMDWTFAEILERASYGVDLMPGDLIGSGTVGTGCFLELNGTAKRLDPNATPQWLQLGDTVELEIEGLGVLRNTIGLEDGEWSILARKHQVEEPSR